MPLAARLPTVHVLLATYNGERHLAAQWASIEAQAGVDVVLHVGDDGSSDGTPALLRELAGRRSGAVREVAWLDEPPRRSAARSFLHLLRNAVDARREAQWFAFCDQDDLWLPGKLARAVGCLTGSTAGVPALYGARTLSVDEDDRELWLSPLFTKPPVFRNALVQSILGGNTMVMNRLAAELLAGSAGADVVAHDWFAYQLVSGAGGSVVYDAEALLRYRQHADNEVGTNRGWKASWRRLRRLLRQEYRDWNARNVAALTAREHELTPDAREVLRAFSRARTARGPLARLRWLARSGVFRQFATQQAVLRLACALGRI